MKFFILFSSLKGTAAISIAILFSPVFNAVISSVSRAVCSSGEKEASLATQPIRKERELLAASYQLKPPKTKAMRRVGERAKRKLPPPQRASREATGNKLRENRGKNKIDSPSP